MLDKFNDWAPIKVFDFGGTKIARYARFTFKNASNALITGIACGRVFLGNGAQGLRNFGWDWVKDWEDPSDVIDTESGVRVKRRRRRSGSIDCPIRHGSSPRSGSGDRRGRAYPWGSREDRN